MVGEGGKRRGKDGRAGRSGERWGKKARADLEPQEAMEGRRRQVAEERGPQWSGRIGWWCRGSRKTWTEVGPQEREVTTQVAPEHPLFFLVPLPLVWAATSQQVPYLPSFSDSERDGLSYPYLPYPSSLPYMSFLFDLDILFSI